MSAVSAIFRAHLKLRYDHQIAGGHLASSQSVRRYIEESQLSLVIDEESTDDIPQGQLSSDQALGLQ